MICTSETRNMMIRAAGPQGSITPLTYGFRRAGVACSPTNKHARYCSYR